MNWIIYYKNVRPGQKPRWIKHAATYNKSSAAAIVRAFATEFGGSWQAREIQKQSTFQQFKGL